jgi:hypothetical protein
VIFYDSRRADDLRALRVIARASFFYRVIKHTWKLKNIWGQPAAAPDTSSVITWSLWCLPNGRYSAHGSAQWLPYFTSELAHWSAQCLYPTLRVNLRMGVHSGYPTFTSYPAILTTLHPSPWECTVVTLLYQLPGNPDDTPSWERRVLPRKHKNKK